MRRRRRLGKLFVGLGSMGLVIVGSLLAGPVRAGYDYAFYDLKNDDPAKKVAIQLNLDFNTNVATDKAGDPIARSRDYFTRAALNAAKTGVEFDKGGVPAGKTDRGVVALVPPKAGVSKIVAGEWEYPVGANRKINLKDVDVKLDKVPKKGGGGGAGVSTGLLEITNNEAQTVYLGDLKASGNLASSLFGTDSASLNNLIDTELGLSSISPLSLISIDPGQTYILDLGDVTNDSYEAAVFDIGVTPDPSSEGVRIGYASSVPEPASLTLVALGGAYFVHRHRRKKAAEGRTDPAKA